MSIPERPAQLLLLQDSLIKLKEYEVCNFDTLNYPYKTVSLVFWKMKLVSAVEVVFSLLTMLLKDNRWYNNIPRKMLQKFGLSSKQTGEATKFRSIWSFLIGHITDWIALLRSDRNSNTDKLNGLDSRWVQSTVICWSSLEFQTRTFYSNGKHPTFCLLFILVLFPVLTVKFKVPIGSVVRRRSLDSSRIPLPRTSTLVGEECVTSSKSICVQG